MTDKLTSHEDPRRIMVEQLEAVGSRLRAKFGDVELSECARDWEVASEIKEGLIGVIVGSSTASDSPLEHLYDEGELVVLGPIRDRATPQGDVEIINRAGSTTYVNVEDLGNFRLVPEEFLGK